MLLYNEYIQKKKGNKLKEISGKLGKKKSSPFLHKDSTNFYKLDLQWGKRFLKKLL